MLKNWKTTAAGVIVVAITAIKIFAPQIVTTEYYTIAIGVLSSLGLIAAKDGSTPAGN